MIHQIDANFLLGFLDITLIEITLSGDNAIVIGMAAAKGNVALLFAGLFVSMPLLMTTGGFVALLIDRARWLIYIGAAAISFTAARMVLEDKSLEPRLGLSLPLLTAICIAAGLILPTAFIALGKLRSKRKKRNQDEARGWDDDAST
jgi:predicted tellurium resistance membrane protein TerC